MPEETTIVSTEAKKIPGGLISGSTYSLRSHIKMPLPEMFDPLVPMISRQLQQGLLNDYANDMTEISADMVSWEPQNKGETTQQQAS